MHSSNPFHEALHSGNLDIMRLLIDHGADVNSLDFQGKLSTAQGITIPKARRHGTPTQEWCECKFPENLQLNPTS